MVLSYTNIVQAVSVAIYAPCFLLALLMAFRLGWSRKEGWFLLITFCALRIAGDAIGLYVASTNSTSIGLYTASAILSSVGLSPLMIAITGFLNRIDTLCQRRFPCNKNAQYLLGISNVPILIAVILSIVGGVQASNNYSTLRAFILTTPFKAGAVLYIVGWAVLVIAIVMIMSRRHTGWISWQDELLLAASALGLVLLLVRIVYIMLVSFSNNPEFSLLGGNETIQLCMETIEEFIIVIMFLIVGFFLKRLPRQSNMADTKEVDSANLGAQEMGRMDANGAYHSDGQPLYAQQPQASSEPPQWRRVVSHMPLTNKIVSSFEQR